MEVMNRDRLGSREGISWSISQILSLRRFPMVWPYTFEEEGPPWSGRGDGLVGDFSILKPLGRGHACLGVTHLWPPFPPKPCAGGCGAGADIGFLWMPLSAVGLKVEVVMVNLGHLWPLMTMKLRMVFERRTGYLDL